MFRPRFPSTGIRPRWLDLVGSLGHLEWDMSANTATEGGIAGLLLAMAELRDFLHQVNRPRKDNEEWSSRILHRCTELQQRLGDIRASLSTGSVELSQRVGQTCEGLKEWGREFSGRPRSRMLKELTRKLSLQYEVLVQHLQHVREETREKALLAPLKPANYTRNVFHMLMGLGAIALYEFALTWQQARMLVAWLAAAALFLEAARRFSAALNVFLVTKVFGKIARPREMLKTNASTWYVMAMLLMMLFFSPRATELALLVLSLADPAATLCGRKWGRRKLWLDKSFVGTGAFLVVAMLVTALFSVIVSPDLSVASRLALIGSVGLAGTLGELGASRIDDNFTIPLMCAGVATVWYPLTATL
jgi:diacylglycerol kinase (CTP)